MAAYTRCLRCAGAPRRPASGSGLSLSILSWHTVLSDPGEFDHRQFQRSDVDAAFAESRPARHSQDSRNPFRAGDDFRGFLVRTSATVCQFARPLHGSDRLPSQRGFYIQASSGLVALPAAGYNYNSDWTPCMGLSLSTRFGRAPHFSSSVSLFDLNGPFLRPDPHFAHVGARRSCQGCPSRQLAACSALARPYLDSSEHDGPLGAVRVMTIRGEPACGRGSIAPQPCIRWIRGPEP